MERLKLRYKVFVQALSTVDEPTQMLKEKIDPNLYKIVRDSQIQRFKYCYEAL